MVRRALSADVSASNMGVAWGRTSNTIKGRLANWGYRSQYDSGHHFELWIGRGRDAKRSIVYDID